MNKLIGNDRVTVMQIVPHALRIQGAVNHPLNELLYAELSMKPGNAVSPTKMRDEMLVEEFPSLETEHLFIIKHINHPESDHLCPSIQSFHFTQSLHEAGYFYAEPISLNRHSHPYPPPC
ncbi:hypothetical protein GCM10008018_53730 [Paenibacillus marchantiophytorum]|uniref:Uncharacterized protein n=1 Tax=Paenibacillus marchantiophytorum TaxID=1619310 RepID=A0ABQ1F6L2_9BACL|nr:hypothetical protein [Paenibacillus marchantiophytorum]GGA00667.1 hypothetical protein GCM10008018_53730 [Paenibacillus marchantiophytorum]